MQSMPGFDAAGNHHAGSNAGNAGNSSGSNTPEPGPGKVRSQNHKKESGPDHVSSGH